MKGVTALVTLICFGKGKGHQVPNAFTGNKRFPFAKNLVFCDGHVAGLNPWLLFNPTNSAGMWNYDHEAHPELWVP